MEWEEALLAAWEGEIPQSATYYRRRAARARQIAEGVTTRAMKARLLDEPFTAISLRLMPNARGESL